MPRRCVVSGCKSTNKQGSLFALKSKDSVRNQWPAILGIHVDNLASCSSICPNHFAPDAWEAVREDGSRRLKRNARPTLNIGTDNSENSNSLSKQSDVGTLQPRLPFGNITNVIHSTQKTPNYSPQTSPPASVEESNLEAANILLSLCNAPQRVEEEVSVEPDETLRISVGEHAYSLPRARFKSASFTEAPTIVEEVAVIPDESVKSASVTKASLNDMEQLGNNPALNIDEPTLYTGGTNPVVKTTRYTSDHLRKLDPDELIAIIEKQRKELQEEKEKNRRYSLLTKSLQGRYQQMKTANATYRTKIKRLADSNVNGLLNVRSRLKEDQLAALCRKSTRGMKWQVSTVRDAIVFKMKMGSKAYSEFVKKVPIYPSERTLQRAVEHMDFDSGILYDVFHAVKDDIAALPLEQRVCVIGGDEMAIEEAEIYDPGSKKMIGKATFGPHTGLAKKAFTMVLGGVARRYRVTGAYVFTSSQGRGKGRRTIPILWGMPTKPCW